MSEMNITKAEDVYVGAANPKNRSAPRSGALIAKLVHEYIIAAVADADAFLVAATGTEIPDAAETVSYTYPAANVSPTDAALRTGIFDVPRNVVIVVTHASSVVAMTFTVYGTDVYGQAMRETFAVTATGTSKTATGVKAFKTITQIDLTAASDASANTVNIGTGSKLGLKYRPRIGGFIRGRFAEDTADSGTYAAPERTTITATSNDVRGTYTPAGTLDGTAASAISVLYTVFTGPEDKDLFGLDQYNG
jgi:hypothetical protein